ncbi:MAG: hypothetical protein KKE62_13510 [Proteobacteria bacterium]|nr:hypothetical protein [Pseudomonadota bacterium]MBU1389839.1 hypothetical protein [Pseudomonadota bacterium]MBU1543848.1 hypothetical protein [Pseudomonadota bacterium]MBU2481131.1 hypothetical protein [Pseudomonadota bacterium]
MKNSTKIIQNIQRYVFINLIFMMLSATVVCAQNPGSIKISGNDGVYLLKKNMYAQGTGTDMMTEKKDIVFPGFGSELNKIAKTLFNFMVNDASSTLNTGFSADENFEGFALTSSYINDQLMGGMKLEFHANPLKGGGALLFKKAF